MPKWFPESPKGAILADLGVIWKLCWDNFKPIGMPNWSQKSVLGHLVGPMDSPRGSKGPHWEPKGAILVDVRIIFGDSFAVKVMPKSIAKFVAFSSVDFVLICCVSGCILVSIFAVFRGLQRRIAKNLDM